MGTYVTDDGFQKKTLVEIKTEMETRYQGVFGDDIDLDPEGPFGQIIGIESQEKANLWDALEEIYTSRDSDQATGVSLTKISRESGTIRLDAAPTIVDDAILYGDLGTTVFVDKKAKRSTDTSNNPVIFSLDEEVIINLSNVKEIYLEIPDDIVESEDYTVTIGGTPYTHTAIGGDDKDDVIDALVILIDPDASVSPENISTELYVFAISTSVIITFSINFDLVLLGSPGTFTANITGAITVPVGVLTDIVTPVSGWNSLNNITSAIVGRAEESDQALRLRRTQELNVGLSTEAAIKAEITKVSGITKVTVTSNRLDAVDFEGRPAHSMEAVVTGGDDDAIAQAIFDAVGGGIQMYGVGDSGTATDDEGVEYTIMFSRPVSVYLWVRITRDFNVEEIYPANGDTLIQDNILTYAETFFLIGVDIIRQKIGTPVYQVPGIGDILIEIALTAGPLDSPTYIEDNIVIAQREESEFATVRIFVQDF